MKTYRMLAFVGTLVCLVIAIGCGGGAPADSSEPAATMEETAPAAVAPAPAAEEASEATGTEESAAEASSLDGEGGEGEAAETRPRLVPPIRGTANLGFTKPAIVAANLRGREFVVTTFRVRNLMDGAIVGLRIEEFWYNEAGDIVTGSSYRHPRPLQPDEIITVTLETPRNAQMDSNQYSFNHANGQLKMVEMQNLEEGLEEEEA